jgi:NADH-quinone oxidoreductase subunit L
MKVAMGLLAVGAIFGGLLQIPKVTEVLHKFLEPSFHDSRFYEELEPSDGVTWIGLAVGALLALGGIALAYRLWVQDPARPATIRARLAGVHGFFVHKWYFDELIEAIVVRPFAWFGRFARDVFERVVVNGIVIGGPAGAVRAGSAAVRAVQSGFLRYYAALLLVGVSGLGLYFLIAAS